MADSISGANTSYALAVDSVFPSPIQLQGFAADDVFDTDAIDSAEAVMGVDGKLSSGFVYQPVQQTIILQADSDSNLIFDNWWAQMQALRQTFRATGVVLFTDLGTKWSMTRGILSSYKPMPDVKRLLQPRRFRITWERVFPSVVA